MDQLVQPKRLDHEVKRVDQLRISEKCIFPVKEPAHMLTCPNQRLVDSS